MAEFTLPERRTVEITMGAQTLQVRGYTLFLMAQMNKAEQEANERAATYALYQVLDDMVVSMEPGPKEEFLRSMDAERAGTFLSFVGTQLFQD